MISIPVLLPNGSNIQSFIMTKERKDRTANRDGWRKILESMLACSPPNITPNKFILTVYRCVCQLSQYLYTSEQNKVNTLYGCRPPQKSPLWSIIGTLGSLLPLFWSFLGWIISCVIKSVNFKFNSEGTSNKVAEMVKRGTVMESEPPGRAGVLLGDVSAAASVSSFPHFFNWPFLWSVCRLRSFIWNCDREKERGLLQTLHHKSKQVYTHKPTNRRVLVREGCTTNLIMLMLLLRLPSRHHR